MIRKLLGTLLVALLLAAPSVAFAQYREFSGKIDRIKKNDLMIDNRMGDKLKFKRADEASVEGEGKTEWGELKKGDWVTVYWKMMDKPRKAYKVQVLPPQAEEGADE